MLEFEYRENCIQSTGIMLRDQLLSLGLLKPGIDCATVGWEEPLEVPPQRFPVAGHVFKQFPTQAERAVDETRRQMYENGVLTFGKDETDRNWDLVKEFIDAADSYLRPLSAKLLEAATGGLYLSDRHFGEDA